MNLNPQQINQFKQNGFVLIENVFTKEEINLFLQEKETAIILDDPRTILEKNGTVRSFFAPEKNNKTYLRLTRSPRLVVPASQLLGEDVYIHQSKINTKHAMLGDWWEWHRDYTFWNLEDGMPTDNVVTAMIYLNDVNEFNGPLVLIPGSHIVPYENEHAREYLEADQKGDWFKTYQQSTFYLSTLTSDLKYSLSQSIVMFWAEKNGLVSAKAPAGSVLYFHGGIYHASSNNLSPWDRHAFLITYNSISNILPDQERPRPDFIANRDFAVLSVDKEPFFT